MLQFRASLSVGNAEQRGPLVHSIVRQMGLEDCADVVIGTLLSGSENATGGISKGERRRLSLGLEMLSVRALPSSCFPSSHSSSAAHSVCSAHFVCSLSLRSPRAPHSPRPLATASI